MTTCSVAVLLSGSGTNLQALFDACDAGELDVTIALVLSDRADAYGVQRALSRSIATAVVPLERPQGPPAQRQAVRMAWERRLLGVLAAFQPDLVLLSGFMRVLSAQFLDRCPGQLINQHPALLPDGGGDTVTTSSGQVIPALRGAHVVADALRSGLPLTGCTIHRVTPVVDDGPVLARAEVPILAGDDEESLHERIKAAERRLVVEVVGRLAREHIHGA